MKVSKSILIAGSGVFGSCVLSLCGGVVGSMLSPRPALREVSTQYDNSITTQTVKDQDPQKVKAVCIEGEIGRECSDCKKAIVTYNRTDCSTYTKDIDDSTCTDVCPKCTQGQETARKCSGCNTASVTYTNIDCSTYSKDTSDSSCTASCPVYTPPARICCKYCTTGKACGDSCISRNYTCHKPPGCACDS